MPQLLASASDHRSFCRLCPNHCGVIVELDRDKQIVDIRPDRDDLTSHGFACFKGLKAGEAHRNSERLTHPLKRRDDGSFERIGWEQAFDEIGERITAIRDVHGGEAIGGMRGGGAGMNSIGWPMLQGFLEKIGSHKLFSITTIDQAAKVVAAERIGTWLPGIQPLAGADVLLLVGTNPLVSLHQIAHDPVRTLKSDIARGMKLLVIDPRRTETAHYAHHFLQPLPGEDSTILAGMIRLVLERGWEDSAFVAAHVAQVDELRAAVAPFTPEYVASRADVPAEDFVALTETFARAGRGRAQSGTGANMGPHSNLVEHLLYTLNVLCGRFVREGEPIPNPGVLNPRYPRPSQVMPATRSWESGYQNRFGQGLILGEIPTGLLADEILAPGEDRIRGFIAHGTNPAVVVPDQAKLVRALQSLELLVTIDVFMTPTAQLSNYVLPDFMQYERADLPLWSYEAVYYEVPWTRYTPAISRPPAHSDLRSQEHMFWALHKRLGLQMQWLGNDLDMTRPPTKDEMLAMVAARGGQDYEHLKSLELGGFFPGEPQYATAGDPSATGRFTVCPPDVAEELVMLAGEPSRPQVVVHNGERATHRFSVRRHRDMFNSTGRGTPSVRKRLPYNTAQMHPGDLTALGLVPGDTVRVSSRIASIDVIVEPDETVKPGVVAIVHGFGALPGQTDPVRDGANSNMLISTDVDMEPINAMPRMTAFAVHIARVETRRNTLKPSLAD